MPYWTRRTFLKNEALLAAGLGVGLPKMAWATAGDQRKPTKLILRADGLGSSELANTGAFKAIDEGLATSVNLKLDGPATLDVLERLHKYPWLSIGWQNDCSGKPVLAPDKVPSLVGNDGRFKQSMRDGFPAVRSEDQLNYDEVVAEFRAQMLLCISILGRAPDTGSERSTDSLVGKAASQVAAEFGLKSGGFTKGSGAIFSTVAHRPSPTPDAATHETVLLAFHPRVNAEEAASGSDLQFLHSQQLRDWIKANKIELINHRDALFGTHEYQNRLRFTGSDLFMRDIENSYSTSRT